MQYIRYVKKQVCNISDMPLLYSIYATLLFLLSTSMRMNITLHIYSFSLSSGTQIYCNIYQCDWTVGMWHMIKGLMTYFSIDLQVCDMKSVGWPAQSPLLAHLGQSSCSSTQPLQWLAVKLGIIYLTSAKDLLDVDCAAGTAGPTERRIEGRGWS